MIAAGSRSSQLDILRAAGYEKPEEVCQGRNWRLWRTTFALPTYELRQEIVFLSSNCSWNELEEAGVTMRRNRSPRDLTVLVSNKGAKLINELDRIEELLAPAGHATVTTLSEFLYRVISRALREPAPSRLRPEQFGLEYFTEPNVLFSDRKEKEVALSPLMRWLRGDEASDVNMAVLLAPAGSGKSTVTLELFRRMAKHFEGKAIPLMIAREQWFGLLNRDHLELSDIWTAAVAHWYEGAVVGPEQLQVFLSCGTVCPIFDGFDELCDAFPTQFRPGQTVEDLLSSFPEGRILITSRNRFWQETVPNSTRSKVLEVDLQPFTLSQRDAYVAKRFSSSPEKIEKARKILERIGERTHPRGSRRSEYESSSAWIWSQVERVDTIPFVVMLAAESADTDAKNVDQKYGELLSGLDPLEGLLLAFCEREMLRQRMVLSPVDQLRVIEALAAEFREPFGEDDIAIALSLFPDLERDGDARQFHDYALFAPMTKGLRFRFPFIREYLIARVIAKWLTGELDFNYAVTALRACADEGGDTLVETCAAFVRSCLAESWRDLAQVRYVSLHNERARSGLVQLLIRAAQSDSSWQNQNVIDELLRLVGDFKTRSFVNLVLGSQIHALDFRGITFVDSIFRDLEWVRCQLDESTRFIRCRFEGHMVISASLGFQAASFDATCVFSPEARSALQKIGVSKFVVPVTKPQIIEAARDILRQFRRGQAGFCGRKAEDVRINAGRRFSFGAQILQYLEDNGVLRLIEGKGGQIYELGSAHHARVFLDNGLRTGEIKIAIDQAVEELVRKK